MRRPLETKMNVRVVVAVCVVCATGVTELGCSSSSGSGAAGGVSAACDQSFDAYVATASCDVALSTSEVARLRPIFDAACAAQFSLPGSGLTAASLAACAQAVQASPCLGTNFPACSNTPAGTLAVDAPCASDTQCASAFCALQTVTTGNGGETTSTCGTCAATTPPGQSCAGSTPRCAPGTECSSDVNPTCVPIPWGAVGDTCNGATAFCNSDFTCDGTGTCALPAAAGAACQVSQDCASPLVCAGSMCGNGDPVGATCTLDGTGCAHGLECDPTTYTCAAVTFANPGDPCGDTTLCAVGQCNVGATGGSPTCPTLVADGQPCPSDATSTCDTFSECFGGVCSQPSGAACK
jgi:hypothetical protein